MKRVLAVVLMLVIAVPLAACNNASSTQNTTNAIEDNSYTVTFDSMGGTAIDSQTVKEGETAVKPTDPQKEGFTFAEWKLDGVAYDFNAAISQDIILVASYNVNENNEMVLVMLDYQNGQETRIVEIIKDGKMMEPPIPVKQGYKFIGWFNMDSKFNFDSSLNEGITLTAKWEEDKTATPQGNKNENHNNNQPNNSGNTTPGSDNSDNPQQNDQTNTTNNDKIVEKYAGRWYLTGYSDVCIDVSQYDYIETSAMFIESHNFSLPMDGTSDFPIVKPYTIYPGKYTDPDKGAVWSSSVRILFNNWNESLKKNKVELGDNYISINNNTFVRTQGNKDRYYDTCYKEALGTWYLENSPTSIIEIFTYSDQTGDLDNSATWGMNTTNFNLEDFTTDNGASPAGGGRADRKSDWDKYGISVKNNTLTVTNENGIRTFYREKTYQEVTGITFDITDITLSPGGRKGITATVSPSNAYNKSIIWSSSNPSVATVTTDGVITAIGEGTATIIATTESGNHTASCNVTVSIIHVNGIVFDKSSLTMIVGNVQQINATISPSNAASKQITWTSNDSTVATVSSSGQVTAVSKGSAVITATTADGGYTAICTVTVTDPPLTVRASIGVGYYMSDSASVRGVYAEAKASGGSGNYVEYYVKVYYNGELVAEGAKNQIIVTLANGTYTAEVYVKDSNGSEATHTTEMTLSGY